MDVHEVTLPGSLILLEPLRPRHAEELATWAEDADTWRYMTEPMRTQADMTTWVTNRLAPVAAGTALAFLQRDARTGDAVGTTSLFDIDPVHRKMEIGFSWLAPGARGGGRNVESKLLLLGHAFDRLGAHRVQWKTDARNTGALRALDKIGATREGTLRSFNVMPDGHRRDAVFFSVLDAEWPQVRDRLEGLLGPAP